VIVTRLEREIEREIGYGRREKREEREKRGEGLRELVPDVYTAWCHCFFLSSG